MHSVRTTSIGTIALRASGVALGIACAIGSVPALADEGNEPAGPALSYDFGFATAARCAGVGPIAPPASSLALDYDLGFVTRPGAATAMLDRAAEPAKEFAAFTGQRMQRSLVIDGVDYGLGDTGIADNKLFVASNLAAIAGLECGEIRMAGDVSLCAVGTRKFWTEGDRLFVKLGASEATDRGGPKPAPELAPANLAFLNYDMSFVSGPGGSNSIFGSFHPALRLKENAFDFEATLFQRVSSSSGLAASDTKVSLSSFAYRREWFERRMRLTAGRTQSSGSGLAGGERFDGISLERFNSDEVGSVPAAGGRPISGYAQGPGVLQYRVGDKVYKQLPVREGKFEVGSEFLADVPRGGRLEYVGVDGLPREISIPSNLSVQYAFYRPGDYSWKLDLGRLNAVGGGRPFASFSARYGLIRDLTAELAIGSSGDAVSFAGAVNWRMPGALGVLNLSGALLSKWNATASSIEANYYNRFGGLSFDLMHRMNFNGGYRGLALASATFRPSDLSQTSRASLGFNLPFPGSDLSVRVVGERSLYAESSAESRLIQFDIGRSFGRLGSGLLMGRFGRDQYGQNYSSVMANWTVPLGRRIGATFNYTTSQTGAQAGENRYSATLWGSSSGAYGLGSNYQISIDQDQRIAADGNLRSRLGALSASLTRNPGERPYGSIGMRGGLVLAGGEITATRQIADSLLVVRSKELGGSNIYVPPDQEGRTRFDGAGLGVITDLPPYREFNLAFDESGLPLGMEISRTNLNGSVRPYRGYLVDIPVTQLRPVRAFPEIPSEARGQGNAFAGDSFAPIELDGSIYFNAWPAAGKPVVLTWQTPDGPRRCAIEFPAAPAQEAGAAAFDIVELRGLACRPVEMN